jgi:gliding motility-associated-like protein
MKRLLLLCCLFLFLVDGQTRHLIGGEITYECLGPATNGMRYKFSMSIYRDCACSNCAPFDMNASIGIYRCPEGNCEGQSRAGIFEAFSTRLISQQAVAPPSFPCLVVPPNICVEEAYYEWERVLPISDQTYYIVHQRCCRNETITNIFNPDDVGSSYVTTISPEAQQSCNSSPEFRSFPPTVICGDQPLEFNHSAVDADGDSLVYEFCAPLIGGGQDGTGGVGGDLNACTGAIPIPACPPPFETVRYIQPTYTFRQPLAGKPAVEIDPNTGIISGTPTGLGQYVVGVCVKEYRDGELIGETRRDFQFNVANCEPTVVADIRNDSIIGDQQFLVNSCGQSTISFENQSFQRSAISSWSWRFDINGEEARFGQWDATVTFPDTGIYRGQLLLNPGTECGDTADIFVNIYPEITADFDFAYDTCVAGPVVFTDLSETGGNQIVDWQWSFGDGNSSNTPNPNHTYQAPGDLNATLLVRDDNNCETGITKPIPYFPVPNLLVIAPSDFVGCAPAPIFFDNLSSPIDETYTIDWSFGDGNSGSDISPTHIYNETGVFDVSLNVTSPIGCQTDTSFRSLIEILPGPRAGFIVTPEELSNIEPNIELTDQSNNAVSWLWDFGDGNTSTLQSPSHSFQDTGMYVIKQIVTHPNGCQDSLLRSVDVVPLVTYFLPNAFTPNNDARNEGYRGTGVLTGISNFKFTIWNRWGEMVYETDDPNAAWNGKKLNEGKDLPNGVYVCLVKFTGPRGQQYEYKSTATIVR